MSKITDIIYDAFADVGKADASTNEAALRLRAEIAFDTMHDLGVPHFGTCTADPSGKLVAMTPDTTLPPFSPDSPRRKLDVTIEVPENFDGRMDMQWLIEREINADRWSWRWSTAEPMQPTKDIADMTAEDAEKLFGPKS